MGLQVGLLLGFFGLVFPPRALQCKTVRVKLVLPSAQDVLMVMQVTGI